MFKHYFERISEQISFFPLFSLCVFFAFFIGLLLYVTLVSKKHIKYMANLPIED
jgi:hypothetical protein